MPERLLYLLPLLGALGSGLVAGTFFAFSTFVMGALAKLPAAQGVAAMQAINVVVINRWFMSAFVGTALLSLGAGGVALLRWRDAGSGWLLAGALLYLVGTFGVTVAGNVPLNDALARVEANTPEAADVWRTYLSRWSTWNHVRTAAGTCATGAFILAFRAVVPSAP